MGLERALDDLLFLDLGVSVTTLSLGYERRVFSIGICLLVRWFGFWARSGLRLGFELGWRGMRHPAGRPALGFRSRPLWLGPSGALGGVKGTGLEVT